MIKIIIRNGIAFQVDADFPFRRYKPGKPKSVSPPALPPAAATTSKIVEAAQKAGETEGRRLRKRTGRRETRKTRPELAGVPAQIRVAGLKTKLGATV